MAGNGLNFPMQKLTMSVTEVMVIDTAASDSVLANLSGTSMVTGVRRHAANMTNVSSMPMPEKQTLMHVSRDCLSVHSAYIKQSLIYDFHNRIITIIISM